MAEQIPIDEAARKPKSVSVDGQAVTQRDLRELMDANRQNAANEAGRKRGCGVRRVQFINRGTT